MSDRNTTAVVRFTLPGWHRWPGAPERRGYLGTEHRHLFHFEVELELLHDDREVEFHDLLGEAKSAAHGPNFGTQSCEQIAAGLIDHFEEFYPGRDVRVAVFEDGECGAVVTNY